MFAEFEVNPGPAFQEAEHAIVVFSHGRVSAVFCGRQPGGVMMKMHSSLHPDVIRSALAILLLNAAQCVSDQLPKAKVLALMALLEQVYKKERDAAEDGDDPF